MLAHLAKDRDNWINCLQSAIKLHANHRRKIRPDFHTRKVPTIEEFNKKLIETDSYLQILISQIKKIDEKINNTSFDHEKVKLNILKEQSVYLLDSIKHTIVLLQIAKVRYIIDIKFCINIDQN